MLTFFRRRLLISLRFLSFFAKAHYDNVISCICVFVCVGMCCLSDCFNCETVETKDTKFDGYSAPHIADCCAIFHDDPSTSKNAVTARS